MHDDDGATLTLLVTHLALLSFAAVGGGVIMLAPDIHRFVVDVHRWITDEQFAAAYAIAQAAPGPNVLFVAVLGWTIAGAAGVVVVMAGMLLPSTVLSLWATRWAARNRTTRRVRAFTIGMAPLTIGLLLATAWMLSQPVRDRPAAWCLIAGAAVVVSATRWPPLLCVAVGAAVGWLGWL